MNFDKTILNHCNDRKDDCATIAKARVTFTQDLHTFDAVYHKLCSTDFRTGRNMPKIFQEGLVDPSKKPKIGRPENTLKEEAFVKVAEYLKANDEHTTINDLIDKMGEFLQGTDLEPYGFTYMKTSLQKHFGDGIIIAELSGYKTLLL